MRFINFWVVRVEYSMFYREMVVDGRLVRIVNRSNEVLEMLREELG